MHLKPQAKESKIVGVFNGRVKIALTAPALEGRANKALIAFMAKLLSIRQQDVTIVRGLHTPLKILQLPIIVAESLQFLLHEHAL